MLVPGQSHSPKSACCFMMGEHAPTGHSAAGCWGLQYRNVTPRICGMWVHGGCYGGAFFQKRAQLGVRVSLEEPPSPPVLNPLSEKDALFSEPPPSPSPSS